MTAKYKIGQKVAITPVKNQHLSPRDDDLEPYTGQVGQVNDYYWIRPNTGEMFYLYLVKMETDGKEIVAHEDELEAYRA